VTRRRLGPDAKRGCWLVVRLTAAEKEAVVAAAGGGRRVSAWIRQVVMEAVGRPGR